MKIAVVGAGSIGGYLGAFLAAAGDDVTFIARGANLDAIRANGMRVTAEDGRETIAKNVRAYSKMGEAGAQDAVLLTVKAHQVAAVAGDLHHLCDAATSIVTMQNGIPWWYFQKHGGRYEGTPVAAADPDGSIAQAVDPARIIGTVVYPAAVLEAPGVVRVVEGKRFTLGELDGTTTPRIEAIAARFVAAGFKAPVSDDLRAEIWLKLIGNLAFNPISALTHATLQDLCRYPLTRELSVEMMTEAETIASKLGITMRASIEKRIAGAEKVGPHKTSMLQDVEHGRPLEIEALVAAVIELGRLTGTPTPHIDSVYACTRLLAQTIADAKGTLRII
ncbi:MAG: ketopantoate reductase family protein [Gemmatimonadales bacterium]